MSAGKPFLLMSGMPVVIEMGEIGAVLRKPLDLDEVGRIIERTLERRREGAIGTRLSSVGAA